MRQEDDTFEGDSESYTKRSARNVTASMLNNNAFTRQDTGDEEERKRFSKSSTEFTNLKRRIKGALLTTKRAKFDKMDTQDRDRLADWISTN